MPVTGNVAQLAKRVGGYDPRLDSEDVVERQQAEIEALRTCLIAANSESNGEYERLRLQLEAMTASHAGQLRNTLAFKAERDAARIAAIHECAEKADNMSDCSGKFIAENLRDFAFVEQNELNK